MNKQQVTEAIAVAVAALAPLVESDVVGVIALRERTRRTNIMVPALDKVVDLEKQLTNLDKTDTDFTDEAGNAVKLMSAKRKAEVGKLKSTLAKLGNAIEGALSEKQDYVTLERVLKELFEG